MVEGVVKSPARMGPGSSEGKASIQRIPGQLQCGVLLLDAVPDLAECGRGIVERGQKCIAFSENERLSLGCRKILSDKIKEKGMNMRACIETNKY